MIQLSEERRKELLEYVKTLERAPEDYKNNSSPGRGEYRFNFWYLEDQCFDTFQAFLEEDNADTRHNMFQALYNIAYAVLFVSKWVPKDVDKKMSAYNYAVDYFEKLVTGKFWFKAKEGNRFPFQQYTRLSIRKYIFKYESREINSTDLNFEESINEIIDNIIYNRSEDKSKTERDLVKVSVNHFILEYMKQVYSLSEIQRLAYLYRDIIDNKVPVYTLKDKYPDLYDFMKIMKVMKMRVIRSCSPRILNGVSSKTLKDQTLNAIKSSVFLLSIANTDLLSKELFLSLDIDSLYRLSELAGGSVITVPTKSNLDYLILTVCTVVDQLIDGEINLEDSIISNKAEYHIPMCRIKSVAQLVDKILNFPVLEKDNPTSEPLVTTIIHSIANIEKVYNLYIDKIEMGEVSKDSVIDNMEKINSMISSTLNTLLNMKHNIEEKIEESRSDE